MRAAAGRRSNLGLLVLLPLAVLTGFFSFAIGTNWALDPSVVHGAVALAILVVAPWKWMVIRVGLAQRRPSRWLSLTLLTVVLITVASGIYQVLGAGDRIGPLTVMQVHVGGGVLALVLVAAHYWTHPVPPRRTDFTRRNLLRAGVLGVAASALWLLGEGIWEVAEVPGARRRFTGSHETGSGNPAEMPVVSWLNDVVPDIDGDEWRLDVDGNSLTLGELSSLPTEDVTAVVDCTGGWYAEQIWSGVRLDRLIERRHGISFEVRSVTGYARRYPLHELDRLWLATHVGGRSLSAGHGFPARLVAPGRRGFWWVKWVDGITVSDRPWWVQSPFPVT